MRNGIYAPKLRDLLESSALKAEDFEFCQDANETCTYLGEHQLSQEDQDRIIELWERHF